ncbi:hypothetical protein SKAU_G00266030 [Synaphobranchus kaupii]|uniref:Homeobox-containing protein 1-like n=1 Tax=Synaphobranchus kaupii TaxID=118154 RepID=A0A9Q1IQ52_SYNKA|nr:hypothetical protein SKAU_G00266030 [Synaphobranchus kaupii]
MRWGERSMQELGSSTVSAGETQSPKRDRATLASARLPHSVTQTAATALLARAMRQWCLPAIAPSSDSEPLLTGVQSPRLPGAPLDARMEYCDVEPRYTIEQIDLLQRLRLSGMSKPQIVHALESLERLDPIPNPAPATGPAPTNAQSSSSLSSSSSLTSATTQTPSLDASPSPSNSYEASPPPLYPVSGGQRSFCYDLAEEDWDVEEKVEDYMRRDSNIVKEEIKVFLNNRRISQAIVGQVTGISQSYISQWLLQQGLEMSDSKRRAFYRWYLLERSSPGELSQATPTQELRCHCGLL